MITRILVFCALIGIVSFSQGATASCTECKSIADSTSHIDAKKDLISQQDKVQESYTLLEKLSKTYGGKDNKTKFQKEAVRPTLDLILKLLKIDNSEYAVEAAYPLIKANKAEFDDAISSLPKDSRDELNGDIETYQNVLKNGNG
jgi:hypothetical protein